MKITNFEFSANPPAMPAGVSPRLVGEIKGARSLAIAFCLLPAVVVVWLVVVAQGNFWLAWAEVFLGASALVSLGLLRVIPFPSPVHVPVLIFQWWFGVGPAVIALYAWLEGDYDALRQVLGGQAVAVLIVALGLPLYVGGARLVLRVWPRDRMTARSVAPAGSTYSRVGVMSLLILWAFSLGAQQIAAFVGLKAFNTVNYLGGIQSSTWWLALIAALAQAAILLQVVFIGRLFIPSVRRSPAETIVTICIVLYSMGVGLLSGWKGAVVQMIAIVAISHMMWRRRVPWLALITLALVYLLLVEPFVAQTRILAEQQRITTAQERTELFKEQLLTGGFFRGDGGKDVNVASPFRGIHDYAARATERSSVLQGPWRGFTIWWGVSTVVPRVLAGAEKRESSIGNYFDRELGDANSMNSVALSIPFEVVGNWGILAGIITFAFLGAGWTAFNIFWLTPERLSDHPLMPFFFLTALTVESSLGSFLAILRNLSLVLAAFWLLMRWLERPSPYREPTPSRNTWRRRPTTAPSSLQSSARNLPTESMRP